MIRRRVRGPLSGKEGGLGMEFGFIGLGKMRGNIAPPS